MTDNSSISTPAPALVELTRGDLVEVIHRGHACVADESGEVLFQVGNPDIKTFLRSSTKPFQAAAVVLSGAADRYGLTTREIALIAGSHGGESFHTETVLSILGKADISPDFLMCGIHPPLDGETRTSLEKEGRKPTSLHHNCSGKHSGMLITCKYLGVPLETYLESDHPIQQRITSLVAEIAGMDEAEISMGIDGCSVPVHGLPLRSIARAFARLVRPTGLKKELSQALTRVGSAMRHYPEMVAASRARICTELMKIGGEREITAKAGAEGVYGVGWFDPEKGKAVGMAVKMEDGQQRGRDPVVIALLQRFGVLSYHLPEALNPMAAGDLTNWRNVRVGELRVAF